MSDKEYVLIDLASKQGKCWSLNPWKTRFALNYKDLPYRTEFLDYPELKTRLSPHMPARPTWPAYSSPTLIFPDGTYMRESRDIAAALEKLHPTPSLHLDSIYLAQVQDLMPKIGSGFAPAFVPLVPKTILREASIEFWYETRLPFWNGKPLDEVEKEMGGEVAVRAVQAPMMAVSKLLIENEGPFFEKEVGYVDFVWAGFVIFIHRAVGPELARKLFDIGGVPDVHDRLVETVKPWSKRDDH